jgi:hypothetical protein
MCIDAMENWFRPGRLIHANTHVASDRSASGGELRLDLGVGAGDDPERLASSVVCSSGILLKL